MLRPFKTELSVLVERLIRTGTVRQMAVYFRDLNNGPWHGINENVPFPATSLMRLPYAMAIMKNAETDTGELTRRVHSTSVREPNAGTTLEPSRSRTEGQTATIGEIVERMLTGADKSTAVLSDDIMDRGIANRMFSDLGLSQSVNAPRAPLSARSFATFFRILFNASYLTRDSSEKILSVLARSSSRSGIVAGVPSGIAVANIYGEQVSEERGHRKESHDCGIVYYPDSPYILCIMTEGPGFEENASAIREISRGVFLFVEQEQRSHKPLHEGLLPRNRP
jgi:beta-lactamase class A